MKRTRSDKVITKKSNYNFQVYIPVVKFIYIMENKSHGYRENIEKTYYSMNGNDLKISRITNTTSSEPIYITRIPGDEYRNIDPFLVRMWKQIPQALLVIHILNNIDTSNRDITLLIKKLYIKLLCPMIVIGNDT